MKRKAGLPKYKFSERSDGWWMIGSNGDECGPYETRKLADEDRLGLLRFYSENPEYIHWRKSDVQRETAKQTHHGETSPESTANKSPKRRRHKSASGNRSGADLGETVPKGQLVFEFDRHLKGQ